MKSNKIDAELYLILTLIMGIYMNSFLIHLIKRSISSKNLCI